MLDYESPVEWEFLESDVREGWVERFVGWTGVLYLHCLCEGVGVAGAARTGTTPPRSVHTVTQLLDLHVDVTQVLVDELHGPGLQLGLLARLALASEGEQSLELGHSEGRNQALKVRAHGSSGKV